MDIIVACKIVPDDQDARVASDGSLDLSRARQVISAYDKNALEGAAMLKGDGSVKVIAVGAKKADDSKVKKDILARGADELFLKADDAADGLDAFATASELAGLVSEAGHFDLIVTGDGSADLYARQVGVQLAAALGLPYVSGVVEAGAHDGKVVVKRVLETEEETVEVSTPAVISIAPDFAEPRICGMKDILAAGKKPMNVVPLQGAAEATIREVAVKAPDAVDRKCNVYTSIDEFVGAVKAAI